MEALEPQQSPVRTLRPVFAFAAIVVVAFALFVSLFPLGAGRLLVKAQDWAALNVGWYYLLAMTLYLVFVVGVALSKYGGIKLGADHDEPEFSYLSWAGMLFAAGHPDIFPARDVALQTAVGHALGIEPRPAEKALAAIAESWSPWRGVAARLFWAYYRELKGREAVPPA